MAPGMTSPKTNPKNGDIPSATCTAPPRAAVRSGERPTPLRRPAGLRQRAGAARLAGASRTVFPRQVFLDQDPDVGERRKLHVVGDDDRARQGRDLLGVGNSGPHANAT
jgi:hypothetical protein